MNNILVVCIGNICRSPMAQAVLGASVPALTVTSAGIGAVVGAPADATAQDLMAARGLDVRAHRARQITSRMCQQADLILTMDASQRQFVEEQFPLVRGRVFRLADAQRLDIPDPYRQPRDAFTHALALIDQGVATWVERFQRF